MTGEECCAGQHFEDTYTYMQNRNARPGILYLSGPRDVFTTGVATL